MPTAILRLFFGKGQTFVQEPSVSGQKKTAFGYVKIYYEEQGRTQESLRNQPDCPGMRRRAAYHRGQHPGSIIILPLERRFIPLPQCSIRQ